MSAERLVETPDLATGRHVRVLVVDDTPALRALTRVVLEGTGFEVVGEAGDGLTGVAKAGELKPDLVLLDLAMPVMDGLEALPRIRQVAPDARVVIVSGFDKRAMEEQVLEAGADAYLQKGLAPDEVVAALEEIFPAAREAPEPGTAPTWAPEPMQDLALAQRLQALEHAFERLLQLIAHDLGEPLHVVHGFAEQLAGRLHGPDERAFCEYILDAARRMQGLVEDVQAYAQAGSEELPHELLDLRRVAAGVVEGLAEAAARAGGRIEVAPLPHSIVASRAVVTMVLEELISNGLRFARPGVPPVVQVSAEATADGVLLHVRDNGIGVEEAAQHRVFEPFMRLHPREAFPGNGVGLAVCRRLVTRQQGRIWVDSDAGGSTFHVALPA